MEWHHRSSKWYYCYTDGLVVGKVIESTYLDPLYKVFHQDKIIGNYISIESAKRALERRVAIDNIDPPF